jgi:phage terminase large subunit-like protein
MDVRHGRQDPTSSVVLPYSETYGSRAIDLYERTGRTPQPWQKALVYDIRAVNDEGLFVHTKFGYEVPRRNGKGEIITIAELDDLFEGRKTLHTAHRVTTSSSASMRLANLLKDMGYEEVQRVKHGEVYEKSYTYLKTIGLERIRLLDTGGSVDFRTRTSVGGLGEGFDTLIVDEAQEYTDDQQNTLQYVVSDSMNPQIILCGTPPTLVSKGTVFVKLRNDCFAGKAEDTGWAEWSTEHIADCNDVDLWYECNPAMGYQLNERKIRAEDKSDELDFNIQRLGYWSKHNLKSEISVTEWEGLRCEEVPKISERLCVGIKYSKTTVSVSVATKTDEDKIFFESIDCQPIRAGSAWILDLMSKMRPESIVIDGSGAQNILKDELAQEGIRNVVLPTVKEIIVANAKFEKLMYSQDICHMDQPSLKQVATNCQKRSIGSNGGFGYKAFFDQMEIGLLDSCILAIWQCSEAKEKKKQRISY